MFDHHLTVRAASRYELDVLSRLAGLDGRASHGGHALLAERDGVPIAAIALTSGRVATDRRHATGDAVRLLRYRATSCCARAVTSARRGRCCAA